MKKLGNLINLLGYLDYVVALGCIGYGVYTKSWWYGAAGLLGLLLAFMQPANYLHGKLEAKLQKSRRRVEDLGEHAELDEAPFVPFGTQPAAGYLPRSRYPGTGYFIGKGKLRQPLVGPRDLSILVPTSGFRETFGVRPGSLDRNAR